MSHRFRAILPVLLMLAATPAPAQEAPVAPDPAAARRAVVTRAVDEVIRPGYRALRASAAGAADAIGRLCETPSGSVLEEARGGFRSLAAAFARVEFVRFGPAAEDNRLERFLFWPDRRGIALRQIQAALADETATVPDAAEMRGRSVAVQGLPALEYVLFGTGAETLADPGGRRRCLFGKAIADNLTGIAGEIAAGWDASDGISRRLAEPNPADPDYRTVDDALGEVLATVTHGLEAVRDLRLRPALGEGPDAARPALLLLQRSGAERLTLLADVRGLGAILEGSGLLALLPEASRWVGPSIQLEFETADAILSRLADPLSETIATEEGHSALATVALTLAGVQSTLATEVAPALGLRTGFSSLDGD